MPTDLRVEVRNFGPETKNGVRVALEVDGERRPAQIVDVPARGRAEAVFAVSFARAGEHTLVARIEDGDKLPLDNSRAHVLAVPPPARVLLVDGAPGAVIDEDEVGYLRAVLEPPLDDGGGIGAAAPFEPRTIPPRTSARRPAIPRRTTSSGSRTSRACPPPRWTDSRPGSRAAALSS